MNRTSKLPTIVRAQIGPRMIVLFEDEWSDPICCLDFWTSFLSTSPHETFLPYLKFFRPLFRSWRTVRDALSDFATATSNSLAKLILNAITSSPGNSTANLGLIPKSISKGDSPSLPGRLRYPLSISPRQSSQSRFLLLTNVFLTARFIVPTILSIFAFPLGF